MNSKFDFICQWDDDALLINEWDDVLELNTNIYDFHLFNWKLGNLEDRRPSKRKYKKITGLKQRNQKQRFNNELWNGF